VDGEVEVEQGRRKVQQDGKMNGRHVKNEVLTIFNCIYPRDMSQISPLPCNHHTKVYYLLRPGQGSIIGDTQKQITPY
jgi:hypothetical protein